MLSRQDAFAMMFWILFFFVTLYLLISGRDALGDLRFIFERRLVRRFLTRFTLGKLFLATALAAIFFGMVKLFELQLAQWPLLAFTLLSVIGATLLMAVAVKDVGLRGARRRYPDRYREPPGLSDSSPSHHGEPGV